MLTPERIARIDSVLDARLGSLTASVEDTYDPHNAAATIRTSEALGLQELHVIEPGERFSAAKGVTRGAHRWIDLHRWPAAGAAVDALHARGFRVYATLPDATAVSIEEVDGPTPVAGIFGNEPPGRAPGGGRGCDGPVARAVFRPVSPTPARAEGPPNILAPVNPPPHSVHRGIRHVRYPGVCRIDAQATRHAAPRLLVEGAAVTCGWRVGRSQAPPRARSRSASDARDSCAPGPRPRPRTRSRPPPRR